MAILVVGGIEVPVRAPLVIRKIRTSPLMLVESGKTRATLHGGAGWTRIIQVRTDPALATISQGTALVNILITPGPIPVSGDGLRSPFDAFVESTSPVLGPGSDMMPTSFELREISG